MDIQESGEDYLEVILSLKKSKENVRSIDIVEARGFSKSSVSRAVNILKDKGYIMIDPSGIIKLTESGIAIAEEITARHSVLTEFFVKLGVSQSVAAADACKIEHDISHETFEAIRKHIRVPST